MEFIWNITGRCNQKCRYCWDSFKTQPDISTEAAKRIIDQITTEEKCKMILFTGGEPLLRDDLFVLCEYCYEKDVQNIKLCTNGLLISDRIKELLHSPVTEIHVSLDDTTSSLLDYRTSTNQVMKNLDILIEQNRQKKKIVLMSVIYPRHIEKFINVLEYAMQKGVCASYQFLIPNDSESDEMRLANERSLSDVFKQLEQIHQKYKRTLDYFSIFYYLAARKYYLEHKMPNQCYAGKQFQVITPAGDRQPCYIRNSVSDDHKNCMNPNCLIWFRSNNRAQRILEMTSGIEMNKSKEECLR